MYFWKKSYDKVPSVDVKGQQDLYLDFHFSGTIKTEHFPHASKNIIFFMAA